MATKKPMTEETKKKISEALKKGFGDEPGASNRTSAGSAYMDQFVSKRVEYEEAKAERDQIREDMKAAGKKMGIKEKAKAKKRLKELADKMKTARKTLEAIKKEASGKKAKADAASNIAKGEARVSRYNGLVSKITDMLVSTDDPDRKARLQARLERAMANKASLEKNLGEWKKVEQTGVAVKRSKAFDFSEMCNYAHLSEVPFKPATRKLSMQERRIDFETLNGEMNTIQTGMEEEILAITRPEIDRVAQQTKKKLEAGDILAIAAILFMFRTDIRAILNKYVKKSFDFGKDMAATELKLGRPGTPLEITQIMNTDSKLIADAYADNLENVTKGAILDGLAAGAAVAAIVSSVKSRVSDEASRAIINTSGTVVGQYINRGRASVMFDNVSRIVAFQRSEVLDARTCAMCLALDERVVKPDDPMARLDIVHSHCRGLWVPIFAEDDEQPEVTGIPKSIQDSFDTVDGRPVVNAYKQLKRPVAESGKEAQDAIRRKLQS